jgi:sugar phosphate isomerase/epimerase
MLKNRVFIHIPYKELMLNFSTIEKENFNIELCVSSDMLDSCPSGDIDKILQLFSAGSRQCTFHAPYRDLNTGSFDKDIKAVVLRRFYQTLELAVLFEPRVIVFHTGFDAQRYLGLEKEWLKNSLRIWEKVLKKAEGTSTRLAVENVFEDKPQQLLSIIKEFHSDLGFCFDVGHYNVFSSKPLEHWFEHLSEYLAEIHLHDNNGQIDEHLAIGQGTFPFDKLRRLLEHHTCSPLLTVEGRDEPAIRGSLEYIDRYFQQKTGI